MKLTRDLAAALLATLAVCVVLGFAFLKTRGPSVQRLIRADEARVRDLGQLAGQINLYYKAHGNQLPESLPQEQRRAPLDPLTQKPYGYSVKSATQYSLCADFSMSSPSDYTNSMFAFWEHASGHKCFDFDAATQHVPATPYAYY